ncbi:ArsR/SmtB family transcription factor [Actinorhabdospora filicis]|uniref:ArsR/SmtB family transcription factor n=1 Tax=Actinorhabdospora filicis TaxID=1785913 RepID=UPI002554D14F|nr:helix-turn-helix domain-containing protein [Actinorhabdospora filicis]
MSEPEITASAEQYKALAHPTRQRVIFTLDELGEATMATLAARLDTLKGNVAHHLKVLEKAGLVEVSRTNTVRGGTEKYYTRAQTRIHIPRERVTGQGAGELIHAVAEEMALAPAPVLLAIRHARLTAAQLEALVETLKHLAGPDDLPDAGEDETRYGIAFTVYPTP